MAKVIIEPIFDKLSDCLLDCLKLITDKDKEALMKDGYYVAVRNKDEMIYLTLKITKLTLKEV